MTIVKNSRQRPLKLHRNFVCTGSLRMEKTTLLAKLIGDENNPIGDHTVYISGRRKFPSHCPAWKQTYDLPRIVNEIFKSMSARDELPIACRSGRRLIQNARDGESIDFKNLLITGGAGFVGSNLALLYREQRPDLGVTVLDSHKRRGSELNLPRLRDLGIEFRHDDIRSFDNFDDLPPYDLMIDCSGERFTGRASWPASS